MKTLAFLYMVLCMISCTKSAPPPVVLQPIVDAGCAVETALANDFGAAVAQACAGNAAACGPAFMPAFGNMNLCNMSLPTPASSGASAQSIKVLAIHPEWKKVGDISMGDLKGPDGKALKAMLAQMGIIGSVVCPIAIPAAMGLLSGIIPSPCACTQSIAAGPIGAAFNTACQAVMAPLP